MKGFLIALLAATCISTNTIAADGAMPQLWSVTSSVKSHVNIRQSPTVRSPIVGTLAPGDVVKIVPGNTTQGFHLVTYNHGLDRGYVWSKLLRPLNTHTDPVSINSLNKLTKELKFTASAP